MNTPLNDGLLRLRRHDLNQMQLTHLMSGLDDDASPSDANPLCGSSASFCGYTEWISEKDPRLTIGWDWQLDDGAPMQRVVRLGLPRTNVLVLDGEQEPLPWNESLHVLATFIDTFDWNTPAFQAVCQRYA
ncbi:DUF4902 domain-containing protein [Variovorax sp. PAMC 28711]|uniref:DUF4902 domain-containing protein n=1 Tax=Variovorax sp. PAMC 28711 TaxID=1795631 RepID=UPI00078E294A|nr:DUF4902 domain-containing protein [Variovorax sp. PAMC 28711]AMM23370.1 hypothetical protein AX767_02570 [Variovorax sp. PAMC 28711]